MTTTILVWDDGSEQEELSDPTIPATPTRPDPEFNRRAMNVRTVGGLSTVSSTTVDIWSAIHAERAALAADLHGLTDDQWVTASLCSALSVRDVLAHLTATASLNPVQWFSGVVRCRFDFDKQVAMRLSEHLGSSPEQTLAEFERVIGSTTSPPLPKLALLGEVIVHSEDIRRPLGIHRDYPVSILTQVAEYRC